MTEQIIIKGARAVDPLLDIDEPRDLLIEAGKIKGCDKPGSFSNVSGKVIDAKGLVLAPGLIDIHVHLREPGQEWKETIATGSDAAVAGGFTTVCCMPNTKPVNDSAEVTKYILKKSSAHGKCRVLPIGAISAGLKGESLSPMLELREAGCVAFSDDGRPVWNAGLMRKALEYSSMLGAVLTVHEEELTLSKDFSMNESALSLKLGLKGMPDAAENVMIARDIELARLTGCRVHFCHVSTARGVTLIRRAKEDGILVTAETAPHYFSLDESRVGTYDTSAKMSMPLRSPADVEGIIEGLASGVLDCIASDHAPHEHDSKNTTFDHASFGILGFQTTLPLTMRLVRDKKLSLKRAIEALTVKPAECFNLTVPTLKEGSVADVVLIDPERSTVLTREMILSKSKNTPFLGETLQGLATRTFMGGEEVYSVDEKRTNK